MSLYYIHPFLPKPTRPADVTLSRASTEYDVGSSVNHYTATVTLIGSTAGTAGATGTDGDYGNNNATFACDDVCTTGWTPGSPGTAGTAGANTIFNGLSEANTRVYVFSPGTLPTVIPYFIPAGGAAGTGGAGGNGADGCDCPGSDGNAGADGVAGIDGSITVVWS